MQQFNANLIVNMPEIDKQHAMMFSMFSVLIESIREGETSDKLGVLFKTLLDYADLHFKTEENLMEQAGYPGIARSQ